MAELDKEWEDALNEEYGDEPDEIDAPDEDEPEAPEEPDTADEDDQPDEPEADADAEGEAEDEEDGGDGEGEPEGESEDEEPAAPVAPQKQDEEPAEQPRTREEIKAALRELQNEHTTQQSTLNTLKDEVLNTIYPEGIDRQLRDADGDPINGLQDLTGVDPQTGRRVGDGLINPVTGEVFTEDEAARYILRGQQQLNEQVEKMEAQAYEIAEVQLSLREADRRIEQEFGPILSQLPEEINKRIADAYIATLRRDPQSGIVVEAPLDAYEFYSIALAGAMPLLQAQPAQPPRQQTPPAPAPAPKRDKGDRADLDQRGTPTRKSKEDSEWEEAFDEILG